LPGRFWFFLFPRRLQRGATDDAEIRTGFVFASALRATQGEGERLATADAESRVQFILMAALRAGKRARQARTAGDAKIRAIFILFPALFTLHGQS